jgi:lipopolysaccharide biosynthesis glycosyltransferase
MSSVWIGFDEREAAAFAVARHSLHNRIPRAWPVRGVVLADLQKLGFYTRPTTTRVNGDGRLEMIDLLSVRPDYDGRISTQHAIARFLVPHLAGSGWALFMDGDMLVRGNVGKLFETLNSKYAVYCVKHRHEPLAATKMDGQAQTRYARKNWSSFLIFNCEHPANAALTVELVNTLPGRDLHALCWLKDEQIGELAPEWNFLVGHSDPTIDPKVVHFTSGTPDMAGYENQPHADAWRSALIAWARGG